MGERLPVRSGANRVVIRHDILPVELFVVRCNERGVLTCEDELELFHSKGWLAPVTIARIEVAATTKVDLWKQRPEAVPYEPWSDLRSERGRFGNSPWYATAQIYPLRCLKNAFSTSLNVEELEVFQTGLLEAKAIAAEAIGEEVVERLARVLDTSASWRRLVDLLTEVEGLIDEYLGVATKDNEADPDSTPTDYASRIIYQFREHARVLVEEMHVSEDEVLSWYGRLASMLVDTVGILVPSLWLRYLPASAIYACTGPMKLGLDVLRDMRSIAALANVCYSLVLITDSLCPFCGRDLANINEPGRPGRTCGDDGRIRKHKALQQKLRRHRNSKRK